MGGGGGGGGHLSQLIASKQAAGATKSLAVTLLLMTNSLSGKLFLVETPHGCHVCFIIPNKYKTQNGEKLQTPEILDKYASSVC